jgi:AraC family transcriptional regulator, regulatory protein of adaptative response / methylated-DNA-[protein]-cysteine methyltransferase
MMAAPESTVAAMGELARYIEDHADEELTLARLAGRAGMSPYHLQRTFRRILGVSPKELQSAVRFERLRAALRSQAPVLDAVFEAGFGSTSRVYERLDDRLGMTPAAIRAGGRGQTIAHAVRETSLGWLLMAATPRGICWVEFGDARDALLAGLERQFPAADLVPSPALKDPELDRWMTALEEHLATGGPAPELPLDLRGTAFQIRVWRFLLSVEPGTTTSYGKVATALGQPTAARAVARACAANQVAVLVPCHRVLRGDGALGGYRWGEHRKRRLLDREREQHGTNDGRGSGPG